MELKEYNKLLVLILFLGLLTKPLQAQYVLKKADRQFQLFNYTEAITLYEEAYRAKPTLHTAQRLGACYNFLNNAVAAESWFAIAAEMPNTHPENILEFAKALQKNAKYAEARENYLKYADANRNLTPKQLDVWLKSCDSALVWMKNPKSVKIENKRVFNSPESDWGGFIHQDILIFVSDRADVLRHKSSTKPFLKFDSGDKPDKQVSGWTGRSYLRLYTASDTVAMLPLSVGEEYHIGPASFTGDGKQVYFALTRMPRKKIYRAGKLATINIEIYSATLDAAGNWSKPMPFKYNNVNTYSVGDPFISKDGNTLYFTSNMPGGLGGTDIYKIEKKANEDWQTAINLTAINSEGNERTPFLEDGANLYFSSDGRVGMGGLDIFVSRLEGNRFSSPENLGYPLNSPQDDFSYHSVNNLSGYLASNRTDGLGDDDIYAFDRNMLPVLVKLRGKVYSRATNRVIPNAIVSLSKLSGESLTVATDENGAFQFDLDSNTDYNLEAKKSNHMRDKNTLTTRNIVANTTLERQLYLGEIVINKPVRLENIYYDFDKSNIRSDAAVELDKLVKILKENPTMWIELGSHTDSRGRDQYNQWLSQSSANSAVQYIIDRGISKSRITARGYGESVPVNKCVNGVKCSEVAHQLNRRTEFRVTKQ